MPPQLSNARVYGMFNELKDLIAENNTKIALLNERYDVHNKLYHEQKDTVVKLNTFMVEQKSFGKTLKNGAAFFISILAMFFTYLKNKQ